jgi:hypothetical protein
MQTALISLFEYGIQRLLFRTPIILAIRILLYGQSHCLYGRQSL